MAAALKLLSRAADSNDRRDVKGIFENILASTPLFGRIHGL